MPTPYLKELSRKGKGSLPSLEKKWERAKEIAEHSDAKEPYGLATHILQKMTQTKPKAKATVQLNAAKRLLNKV